MSGLGEALVGVAAVASISQLLAYVLQTSQALAEFYQSMESAPSEISRVQRKVSMLHSSLEYFNSGLAASEVENLLPPGLRTLIKSALQEVHNIIIEIQQKCLKKLEKNPHRIGSRFRFAWCERKNSARLLSQLQEAEIDLMGLIQLLHVRTSSLSATSLHTIEKSLEANLVVSKSIANTITATIYHDLYSQRLRKISPQKATSRLKESPTGYILARESWLRHLGFYWAITFSTSADSTQSTKISMGFKPPLWFTRKILSVNLHILRLRCSSTDVAILPGFIRIQNQVPLDSPFMKACMSGDTSLISQIIAKDPECLNNRTVCSGKTPLLLAIESKNLDSIRCLLEAGADPNMGDDDRMLYPHQLPVFAALGYNRRRFSGCRTSRLAQLPPKSAIWLDILQLLVQYGASVHEVLAHKTMTTLRYSSESTPSETTLRYFRLLQSESYVDFDVVDDRQGQSSALWNATRCRETAALTIDMLAQFGVQMGKIYSNGRNALHIAAEMAYDAEPLKHLFFKYGVTDVNRQDSWGWTPLHYAIMSTSNQRKDGKCGKVRFLLGKGADPSVKGFKEDRRDFHPSEILSEPVTPFEYAAALRPQIFDAFANDMKFAGIWPLNDKGDEEDVFFDACEEMSWFVVPSISQIVGRQMP